MTFGVPPPQALAALLLVFSFSSATAQPRTSEMEVNLAAIPFDYYNYSAPASPYFPSTSETLGGPKCLGKSVRQCVKDALASYAQQGFKGVRFMYGLCGGAWSSAFTDSVSTTCFPGPGRSLSLRSQWQTNLQSFLSDVADSGIKRITPTPMLYDFGGEVRFLQNVWDPCTGNFAPNSVKAEPTAPFMHREYDLGGVNVLLPWGFMIPQGYNCAPANPHFIGWPLIFQHFQFLFGNATYAGTNPNIQLRGLLINEVDFRQELDLLNFTVLHRFVLDNKSAEHRSPANTVPRLMVGGYLANTLKPGGSSGSYGLDGGIRRVTFSTTDIPTTLRPIPGTYMTDWTCYFSMYNDPPRLILQSALVAAMTNGKIGLPSWAGAYVENGLWCGGDAASSPNLLSSGIYDFLPNIIDIHTYPHVRLTSGPPLNAAEAEGEAFFIFTKMHDHRFLNAPKDPHGAYGNALFMIGETHSNSYYNTQSPRPDGQDRSCENNIANIHIDRPFAIYAMNGLYRSVLTTLRQPDGSTGVIVRPWNYSNSSCFPFPHTTLGSVYQAR